jgi:hypothetical protein
VAGSGYGRKLKRNIMNTDDKYIKIWIIQIEIFKFNNLKEGYKRRKK